MDRPCWDRKASRGGVSALLGTALRCTHCDVRAGWLDGGFGIGQGHGSVRGLELELKLKLKLGARAGSWELDLELWERHNVG